MWSGLRYEPSSRLSSLQVLLAFLGEFDLIDSGARPGHVGNFCDDSRGNLVPVALPIQEGR
jgi:hypothetical protein